MKLEKVIISGGGTGGHIFPALAIANEILRRYPDVEILFVGALGRMEMEKVPAAGYNIVGLPIMGFPRKPSLKMFTFFRRLLQSATMARRIVKGFKPQVAVGVGGYASGPLLRAAAKMKVPTLIQEQNSYAGITNKLLGKKADKICVAYPNMDQYFPADKIVFSGNPVRDNMLRNFDNKRRALEFFGFNSGDKTILVTGGSLGAGSINNAVLKNLEIIANSGINLIWQTGAHYYEAIQKVVQNNKPENVHIHQFITRMDFAYSVADVVITRAGAGTISELCLVGKPVILIPSPNVAEDHQTKNAMALVEKEAAMMLPDKEIEQNLFPLAFDLIYDDERLKKLSENIITLAKPNATLTIVDEVEKLLER